jgi:hypothetical protein
MDSRIGDVDITPKEIGGRGQKGRKTTVFQQSELNQIVNNPGRLTKEGIEKKIELWRHSNNAHQIIKYRTMLQRCKEVQKSGKDSEGNTIYSYDRAGNPHWTSKNEDRPFARAAVHGTKKEETKVEK